MNDISYFIGVGGLFLFVVYPILVWTILLTVKGFKSLKNRKKV